MCQLIVCETFANVISSLKLLMNYLTHCNLPYPFKHLNVPPEYIYIIIYVDMVQQLIELFIAEDCRKVKQRPACHILVLRAPDSVTSPDPRRLQVLIFVSFAL